MGSHMHNNHHHHHHGESHEDFDPGELYSQDWVQDQIRKIQGFIRANAEWLGLTGSTKQRMLDYACGHGTISLALASEQPNVTFRGIDSHPKQATRYNEEAFKLFGEDKGRMYAIQGDLSSPSSDLNGPEWFNFDVAIISMALHHVQEPADMLSELRKRLNSGGSLIVVEWYGGDNDREGKTGSESLNKDDMIEVHGGHKIWSGFATTDLEEMLEKMGFKDVEVKVPGLTFDVPVHVGGPNAGSKKLMFVKAVNSQ